MNCQTQRTQQIIAELLEENLKLKKLNGGLYRRRVSRQKRNEILEEVVSSRNKTHNKLVYNVTVTDIEPSK